jgi:hypothetical protein
MTAVSWKDGSMIVFPAEGFQKFEADVPKIVGHKD